MKALGHWSSKAVGVRQRSWGKSPEDKEKTKHVLERGSFSSEWS